MFRYGLVYLLLSIFVVFFAKYAHLLIVYIDTLFTYINLKLTPIFSQTGWGLVIRKVLIVILLPIMIAGIPALTYRAIKGKDMPHFLAFVWVIWMVIVLSDILIR